MSTTPRDCRRPVTAPATTGIPLAADLIVAGLELISGAGEIALAADGLKLAKAAQLTKGLLGGLG